MQSTLSVLAIVTITSVSRAENLQSSLKGFGHMQPELEHLGVSAGAAVSPGPALPRKDGWPLATGGRGARVCCKRKTRTRLRRQ